MNYPQALAAAHVVGERLGERIGGTPRGGAPPSPSRPGPPGQTWRRRAGG